MGLRGFVDAWGNPVAREGFTRPALTEPESNKLESNKPSLTRNKPHVAKPTKPSKQPKPAAVAAEPAGFDRAAYQREYMRARRAAKRST